MTVQVAADHDRQVRVRAVNINTPAREELILRYWDIEILILQLDFQYWGGDVSPALS